LSAMWKCVLQQVLQRKGIYLIVIQDYIQMCVGESQRVVHIEKWKFSDTSWCRWFTVFDFISPITV
jgi:hypothetical protein